MMSQQKLKAGVMANGVAPAIYSGSLDCIIQVIIHDYRYYIYDYCWDANEMIHDTNILNNLCYAMTAEILVLDVRWSGFNDSLLCSTNRKIVLLTI